MQDSDNDKKYALIIGANGGIGQEIVKQVCAQQRFHTVFTLSRSDAAFSVEGNSKVVHQAMDTSNETAVKAFTKDLKKQGVQLSLVICATGILHQQASSNAEENTIGLKPEKRLEDIHEQQLSEYFRINSILPAIWLQNLVDIVDKKGASIVFFSARVGSISENGLGGWYGYRASKAALNMLVKTAAIEYQRRKPNTSLMCYHPGTVDTGLSKPFQANVKPEKLFTPEFTVNQLLSICTQLDPEKSPYYLDWGGKTIAW
ncbi:SDR family NAD(P)-dependent oxidoreductase [Glaciecola sp. MF2-115]|uniref:SDR family NAD(P)-dependent oxidoreductase n=1 Tax=Glaciecola sp. MF2-115 TaxID=3384827 RepID=UPI0039A2750E